MSESHQPLAKTMGEFHNYQFRAGVTSHKNIRRKQITVITEIIILIITLYYIDIDIYIFSHYIS
jgi:hypothetical protein